MPGIVEWPARIPKPFITQMACSTLDIFPTVLEAAGAVAKNQTQPLDGISLIPLFDHKTESRSKAIPFWAHGNVAAGTPGHSVLLEWPYKLHLDPKLGKGVTQGEHPIKAKSSVLLYDVSKDPKETTDLAAQEPERVKKMTAQLVAWRTSVDKSLSGADYPGGLKKN